MTSSIDIRSPPVKVYSESHQRQRRLQPVSRTKTQGRPAWVDSPWMLKKISVIRIGCPEFIGANGSLFDGQPCAPRFSGKKSNFRTPPATPHPFPLPEGEGRGEGTTSTWVGNHRPSIQELTL